MTKTATHEAEPALFAMKDVTPKKGTDKKPDAKPEKRAKAKRQAATAVAKHEPQRAVAKAEPKEPTNMLAVIARAASDPRCNPENMRMMLDMQKEIVAEEARMTFTEAFIALQEVLPTIDKDGKIDHGAGKQKNLYSTYPNIMKIVKPLLIRHKFALGSWIEPSADGMKINVVSQLDHIKGHHRKSVFPLGAETSGSKNNIQGWGSSQSYGMRYNAIGLLNIISQAPQDRDNDGTKDVISSNEPREGTVKTVEADRVPDKPKRLTLNQSESLTTLMKNCKVTIETFCDRYGIAAVIDLNPSLLPEAEKALKDYAKTKGITLPAEAK